MRKSELFHLRWDDIDFVNNSITIQSKADWHTKNRRYRVIEMTPRLRDALLQERRDCNSEHDFVLTYRGDRLRSNVTTTFHRIVDTAGLCGGALPRVSDA